FAEALAGQGPTTNSRASGSAAHNTARNSAWRRRLQLAGAVAVLAIGAAGWLWMRGRNVGDQPVELRYLSLGDSALVQADATSGSSIALSRDGAAFAFVGDKLDRIWVKQRDVLNPAPIPGTEHATDPVFSPDGRWIAYVANDQLKKVRMDGGPSTTLTDSAADGEGIAWLDDGTIIFTNESLLGLRRVSEDGGTASAVVADTVLRGDTPMSPTPLPGGRGVLFGVCASNCVHRSLHVLDFKTGTQKLLVDGAAMGLYLQNGNLLFVRDNGVVEMMPFDLSALAVHGTAVPVLQRLDVVGDRIMLTVSATGTVVYAAARAGGGDVTLRYADHTGKVVSADPSWQGVFNSFAISPDGHRAAVSVTNTSGGFDIWIKQLDTGPLTRLTFSGRDRRPAWSPDGRDVAFVRDGEHGKSADVYERAADGAGADRRLLHLDRSIQEVTWSHDGRWLVVRTDNSAAGNADIVAVRTTGDSTPVPVAATEFTEVQPATSPDDRWLAYVSNEAGRNEVYVRPFPSGDGSRWQVSNGGGGSPAWSSDGKQLYFLNDSNQLLVAQVSPEPTFHVTGITPLFNATRFEYIPYHQAFDMMPDGRFAFLDQPGQNATTVQLVEVDNWFAELRTRRKQ
ncbi:MAG: hypothetical protein ABI142_05550, partial [Bryocella sp.]